MRDGRAVRAAFGRAVPPADADVFAATYPGRARAAAASALYRQFLLREIPAAALRRAPAPALPMPVKILFGVRDAALRPSMLDGLPYEVERVPEAGHFILDERPALVADRAARFFN